MIIVTEIEGLIEIAIVKLSQILEHSELINVDEHFCPTTHSFIWYELLSFQNFMDVAFEQSRVTTLHIKFELTIRHESVFRKPGAEDLHHTVCCPVGISNPNFMNHLVPRQHHFDDIDPSNLLASKKCHLLNHTPIFGINIRT